jgi:hypothetical protein
MVFSRDDAEPYLSNLNYAKALGRLDDERADTYYQKAMDLAPHAPADWSTIELYIRYLFEHNRPQAVLDLLGPELEAQASGGTMEDFFHFMKCRALERLGREAEAQKECEIAREKSIPLQQTPSPLGATQTQSSDLQRFVHSCSPAPCPDDCRSSVAGRQHPQDPWGLYYWPWVWNLADVIENEAGAELYGSRAAVAWTIRDRTMRGSTPDSGTFPGSPAVVALSAIADCS